MNATTRELSHCLRTNLNGVFGMLQLLGTTELDNEQRLYLDALQESAENLLACADGIIETN